MLQEKFNGVFNVGKERYLFDKHSLHCLGQNNKFRACCVHIIVNKWFDRFITVCILINSAMLASKEYEGNYDANFTSEWNTLLDLVDQVFSVIYIIECLLKIVS